MDQLRAACEEFMRMVNARVHAVTREVPADRLERERSFFHPIPARPFTAVLGQVRKVGRKVPIVQFEYGQYSVPHTFRGQSVYVRAVGCGSEEEIVTFVP